MYGWHGVSRTVLFWNVNHDLFGTPDLPAIIVLHERNKNKLYDLRRCVCSSQKKIKKLQNRALALWLLTLKTTKPSDRSNIVHTHYVLFFMDITHVAIHVKNKCDGK